MRRVLLAHAVDWHGWRDAARNLALGAVPPEQVLWSVQVRDDLFVADTPDPAPAGTLSVPRSLMTLGETVIQHSDPQRFALLYRLLWRIHQGERHLMDQPTDPDITRVRRLAQAVRRDTHKMRAFLRFREIRDDGAIRHVGWFEPSHFIVEANAGFFVRRFAGMTWSILTPYRSAHWTGAALTFTAGARAADVPDDDRLAAYWDVYFASIFNPARLKVAAMRSEMPQKYWRNLPEAAAIPDLVRGAAARTQAMLDRPRLSPPRPSARQFRPAPPRANSPLAQARQDIAGCTRCPLHGPATQPVFGEGPADAGLMLIGAQPGDHDDLGGRPFTGPAGQLLDRALAAAGIDRASVYLTYAVKHFRFTQAGRQRLDAAPDSSHLAACRHWLEIERQQVRPRVTVLLGGALAAGLTRGQPIAQADGVLLATCDPAAVLRQPNPAAAEADFTADLRRAWALASGHPGAGMER